MNTKHNSIKLLAAFLSVMMLAAMLAGCGSAGKTSAAAAGETAASTETKVYS